MAIKETNEVKSATTPAPLADQHGLLSSWVELAAGVATRGVGTGFGVVQDVRGELLQRVGSVIDFVDQAQQGQVKLARSIHQRVDELSSRSIEAVEQALLGVVSTARSAGEGAATIAAQSAQSLTSRAGQARHAA